MDIDIDLKFEPRMATGVDNASNGAGCGLVLGFQFRLSPTRATFRMGRRLTLIPIVYRHKGGETLGGRAVHPTSDKNNGESSLDRCLKEAIPQLCFSAHPTGPFM